jgi:hypothetical protein
MRHVISRWGVKRGTLGLIVLMATLSAGISNVFADGGNTGATAAGTGTGTAPAAAPTTAPATAPTTAPAPETDTKGLPLPLHAYEGVSGAFIIPSAYLANPARDGDVFGLPSVGGIYVGLGHGRDLDVLTITENLWGRVELGYGYNRFDIGDLGTDIQNATGISIHDQFVELHHFNARYMLIKDGDFGEPWVPAVTAGAEYMYNDTESHLDHELHGTLSSIGVKHDQGCDYTLHASKMIKELPRPVMLTAGARLTEAAQNGLLGFTDEWKVVGEASACVMVTDRIILAAEYRQNPDEYKPVSGLIAPEADWWSLCAAYILSKHATIAAGYANFGTVMNHEAREVWGVAFKYEF